MLAFVISPAHGDEIDDAVSRVQKAYEGLRI